MGNQTKSMRAFAAIVLAMLVGFFNGIQVAQAAEVNAIVPGSVKITKASSHGTLYLWNMVKIEADWRIPDLSGKAGDTFKLGLPSELEGTVGVYDLKDKDGADISYGSCVVQQQELVCTLNANVENRYDVGGSLWIDAQIVKTFSAEKLVFTTMSDGKIEVGLPDGQIGVGYSPYVPTTVFKDGWFMDDPTQVKWRVVVPGSKLASLNTVTVTDSYDVDDVSLTMAPGYPLVYSVGATPACWNLHSNPGCYTELNATSDPSATVAVDDDADKVSVMMKASSGFAADRIYVVELTFKADRDIAEGTTWTNKATVNGEEFSATATKRTSGAGTGSGVVKSTVAPVTVTPGVCQPGATSPSPVVVSGAVDTDEVDYSEPVVVTNGDQVTVTVTATAKGNHVLDTANLPAGWSVVNGVVTFSATVTQPTCTVASTPATPTPTTPAPSKSAPAPSKSAPAPSKPAPVKPAPKKPGLPKTGS